MAIENTYLLGKNITLGCGFDLQAKAPLDSRMTVATYEGLAALVNGNAAYEGMRVFVETGAEKGNYQYINGEWKNELAELKTLIGNTATAAMEFKGAATALPENPAKGDMYKVTAAFKVGEEDVKIGDSIVYDGAQWFIIPSGDDIEDTWRPVTDVDNDATLTFVAGDKLEKTVAADGTITYRHAAVDAPELLAENEQTRTYITEVETDGFGHITGYKTATENVVDTNTTYEFEGLPVVEGEAAPSSVYFQVKADDAEAAEVIYLDAYNKNEADAKFVAKEEGKSLISDDEIARLADVDNYDDQEVRGLIDDNAKAIEDLEAYVGTFTASEGIDTVVKYIDAKTANIASDERVNGIDNRVKAIEEDYVVADDIADFETKENVKKVADDLAAYVASNNEALAGVKATADAAAVKTEVESALAGKVDKVEGKSLILDTEIERLATLHNYDDTQVKADIAKKADAETMTTELGKKVDKVEGYSLVSDAEIARLATLKNYDDTALAGRVTDAEGKIADLETESAKHALKSEVETELAKYVTSESYGVDKKATEDALADRYTKSEADGKFALKGADAYDDTDLKNRVKAIEDDYLVEEDIADFETKANVKKVSDALDSYKTENNAAVALKADKSVVDAMYTNAKIDELIQGAKDYADANDADTKYGIVYDSDNKKIKLVEGGTDVEIDASAFIKDGMISNVTIGTDNDLVITFNTDAGKENIVLPLDQLVDIYTGVEGARVKVTVNADKTIAADLVDGSIGKDYLDDGIKASLALADSAIQSHQDISHLATTEALNNAKTELSEAIEAAKTEAANQSAVVLAEAQQYCDAAKVEAEAKAAELDAALKAELQGEIDADVQVVGDALDQYKTDNDAAVALKANAADVYEKSETFTKDEVNAAIEAAVTNACCWGEF